MPQQPAVRPDAGIWLMSCRSDPWAPVCHACYDERQVGMWQNMQLQHTMQMAASLAINRCEHGFSRRP